MNEQEFERAFKAWSQTEASEPVSPALRVRVLEVPLTTPQPRGWLPQSPKWRFQSMFSATRFVVSGVIVALVGGFLLTGILPRLSDAPTYQTWSTNNADQAVVRSDILPGISLTVEEVQPGVFQVLGDGAGDDTALRPPEGLVTGLDGKVFTLGYSYVHQLGQGQEDVPWNPPEEPAIGEDGRVWQTRDERLLVADDGSTSVEHERPDGVSSFMAVVPAPGAGVWVSGVGEAGTPWVARLLDGEWVELPDPGLAEFSMTSAPDGTLWLIGKRSLRRWDGQRWEKVATPFTLPGRALLASGDGSLVAIGSDGTLWTGVGGPRLARLDADGWQGFGRRKGVNWLFEDMGGDTVHMAVDGKGTLWIGSPYPGADRAPAHAPGVKTGSCSGVISFDGKRWHQYLAGICVSDVTVDRHGSIWVATQRGLDPDAWLPRLYVITPEAVAATQ